MDILAAMFAYLGCLAGIIGALTISAFLVLSPSTRSGSPLHTAQTATVFDAKTVDAKAVDAKTVNAKAVDAKASGIRVIDANAAKAVAPKNPVNTVAQNNTVTPKRGTVTSDTPNADTAAKARISRAQQQRLMQEERARRWAYRQDDFESRFMSYADSPPS